MVEHPTSRRDRGRPVTVPPASHTSSMSWNRPMRPSHRRVQRPSSGVGRRPLRVRPQLCDSSRSDPRSVRQDVVGDEVDVIKVRKVQDL